MVTRTIPVFPLDLVLFPRQELTVTVFEPRYKQLVEDCMVKDGLFGVCLTRPGNVLGWESPAGVGSITKIVKCQDMGLDGLQVKIDTVGRGRFRILDIVEPAVPRPANYDPHTLEGHQRFQDMYEKAGGGKMYIRARVEMMPEVDQSIPAPAWRDMVDSWKRKIMRLSPSGGADPQSLDHLLERYYLVTETPTPDYVYSLAALGAKSPQELQPILEADTLEDLIQRVKGLMEAD